MGGIKRFGKSTSETINGTSGNDFLAGNGGNDTLRGLGGNDNLDGGTGRDRLFGGAGRDKLRGRSGNDKLDGGTGADTMIGDSGNDSYVVDNAGDIVRDSSGTRDFISSAKIGLDLSSLAHGNGQIENATLIGTLALNLKGNALNNTLIGNAGTNSIDGGAGNDILTGGLGKDSFVFDLKRNVFSGDLDTINDFTKLDDILSFINVRNTNLDRRVDFADLNVTATIVDAGLGKDVLVTFGGGARLVFKGAGTGAIDSLDDLVNDKNTQTLVSGAYSTLDLSTITAFDGFRLNGAAANDFTGCSVSFAGDINGDGFGDIIVGASDADANNRTNAGAAYVIFGKAGGFGASFDLSNLTAADGFRINGAAAGDYAGTSVSDAGDVNGDGLADLIIGAPNADPIPSAGAAYIVFGKAAGFGTSFDLSALTAADGFRLNGVASFDSTGVSVSSIGDVNGDGFDDIIVGASYADPNGQNGAGAAYVIFGKATGFGTSLNLSALTTADGFRLNGVAPNDLTGISVSSAGDVNGDGFSDIIVGVPYANLNGQNGAGAAYVIFGKADGFGTSFNLSALTTADGFRLNGAAAFDKAGIAVSSAGDVNGDGFDDLIVGASDSDSNGKENVGAAYVIFGKATGFETSFDLSTLGVADGFRINGAAVTDYAGISVSSAGDINGDGFDDLIVGSAFADPNGLGNAGAAYVIFGKDGGFGTSFNLSSLTPADGFRLNGVATYDSTGRSVSSAGDIDGDGFDDLIVGADKANSNGQVDSGAPYVIYGWDVRNEVDFLGQDANDTFTGTAGTDIMVGGRGNDTIDGGGGEDVIHAGSGDDTIHVDDLTFFRIDGGGGMDKLVFDQGINIDFAALRGKISGIEILDFTNNGNEEIRLHKADLLDLDCDNKDVGGITTLDNVALIDGNVGDRLQLFNDGNWTIGNIGVILTGYRILTSGNIQLAVDGDITILPFLN